MAKNNEKDHIEKIYETPWEERNHSNVFARALAFLMRAVKYALDPSYRALVKEATRFEVDTMQSELNKAYSEEKEKTQEEEINEEMNPEKGKEEQDKDQEKDPQEKAEPEIPETREEKVDRLENEYSLNYTEMSFTDYFNKMDCDMQKIKETPVQNTAQTWFNDRDIANTLANYFNHFSKDGMLPDKVNVPAYLMPGPEGGIRTNEMDKTEAIKRALPYLIIDHPEVLNKVNKEFKFDIPENNVFWEAAVKASYNMMEEHQCDRDKVVFSPCYEGMENCPPTVSEYDLFSNNILNLAINGYQPYQEITPDVPPQDNGVYENTQEQDLDIPNNEQQDLGPLPYADAMSVLNEPYNFYEYMDKGYTVDNITDGINNAIEGIVEHHAEEEYPFNNKLQEFLYEDRNSCAPDAKELEEIKDGVQYKVNELAKADCYLHDEVVNARTISPEVVEKMELKEQNTRSEVSRMDDMEL